MTNDILESIANSDEFLLIVSAKTSNDERQVKVILGCDPNGPMIDIIEQALIDVKNEREKRSKTDTVETESYNSCY